MRGLWGFLMPALLAAAACTAPAPVPAPVPAGTLRIATATRAGVYYPMGEAMARLWAGQVPGLQPRALLTAGSPENIDLLLRGEAEVAFAQSGVAYAALGARGTGARGALRGLTHLYPNAMHLVVRRGSGIRTVADLRGRRFVPGARDSATAINSAELLSLHGLSLADVEPLYLGYAEAVAALASGQADAALVAGGLPTPAVAEMLAGGQAELLPLDPAPVMRRYPWYHPHTIPAGTYPGQGRDVRTVAVANILIARAALPEDLVYRLVRALYEGRAELVRAHPAAAAMRPESALLGITGVIDLHPGASRYLREVGVLP